MKWPNFDIEHHRIREGHFASSNLDGPNGHFRFVRNGVKLTVIASDGMGWDHVSVSVFGQKRCPTWDEMSYIKRIFWSDDECVIEFHPPAANYVNNHPYVLHLWKPQGVEIQLPPEICVGVKGVGVIKSPQQARRIAKEIESTMQEQPNAV